jgi:hypothetical protein
MSSLLSRRAKQAHSRHFIMLTSLPTCHFLSRHVASASRPRHATRRETKRIRSIDQDDTMTEGQEKVVCENCDKSTQKELPQVSTAAQGMACEKVYLAVSECMDKHKGQISSCVKEWDAFKACHEKRRS